MSDTPVLLTWYDLERDVTFLAAWIKKLPNAKTVYGIPRGGLPLAVMISHRCDLELITRKQDIDGNTVIVDDVIEQGITLRNLLEDLKGPPAAVFTWCDKTDGGARFSTVRRFPPSRWIVFPWEVENRAAKEAEDYYAVRAASK